MGTLPTASAGSGKLDDSNMLATKAEPQEKNSVLRFATSCVAKGLKGNIHKKYINSSRFFRIQRK